MPLIIEGGSEVRVREVNTPNRVNAGEPFQVQVVVHADQDCDATLQLYQRVEGGGIASRPENVQLRKGENTFLLQRELASAGFYEFEARVDSEADTVLANNEGRSYSVVYGEPTVLSSTWTAIPRTASSSNLPSRRKASRWCARTSGTCRRPSPNFKTMTP